MRRDFLLNQHKLEKAHPDTKKQTWPSFLKVFLIVEPKKKVNQTVCRIGHPDMEIDRVFLDYQ